MAAFERGCGYSRQEVIGRTVHELGIRRNPADRALMIAQLSKGGPIRNVITYMIPAPAIEDQQRVCRRSSRSRAIAGETCRRLPDVFLCTPTPSAKSFAPLTSCPPMVCRCAKSMALRGRANRAALSMLCERALTGNTILRTAQRGRKYRAG